jgi:hypothetical protein
MKKLSLFLAALLIVPMLATAVFCADGDELTTNSLRVDSNGQLYHKSLVEVANTSDTLTAAESGKTIFTTNNDGYIEITLPAAADGLTYRIVSGSGNTAGGIHGRVYVDPADDDVISACTGANDAANMIIGDCIYNNSTSGDSVLLIATDDTGWACVDKSGTWSDGGTGP